MINYITDILTYYTFPQILFMAMIVSGGVLLQSAVGFGFALVAIPLLIAIGLPLHQAIIVAMVCQVFQEMAGLFCVKEQTPFRPLMHVIIPGVLFLILGVILLTQIENLDKALLRSIIGIVVLASVAIEYFWKRTHQQENVRPFWGILAGSLAGVMTATVGITGPPIVLWAMAHDWPSQRLRGSIWAVFLFLMVPMLILLITVYQKSCLGPLVLSLLLIPLVFLFSKLGVFLGNKIPDKVLRTTVISLLVIIGLCQFV